GIGSMIGFFSMRSSIKKIQELSRKTRGSLGGGISVLGEVKDDESEITQLAKTFNEITKNLEENIKRLEASKRTIQDVLTKLAAGISNSKNIDTFLELIIEVTTNALDAKTGALMLVDDAKQELYIKASAGIGSVFSSLRLKIGEEGPGWAAKNKKPLLVPDVNKTGERSGEDPFAPPLLCAPMLYKDKIVGVLAVAGKIIPGNFQEDELIIISNLATQTAVAVENERLNIDAEKTYLETISALAMAVEARDLYSRGHSDRVADYSVKIAKELGLDQDFIKSLKDAALLHDVGKIGISDDILRKPTFLNEDEARVMRGHPVIGEGIVKPIRSLSRLCSIIRYHHESLDGTGYPDGLKGDEIPMGARILSIADSFDAMTTDRPYRKGLSFSEAKEELKKYSGIRYDPKTTEIFINLV
ncbi:MAG: HD domain-containing protein, partial [Candidatus Omnitrophica bacterium]|nr:HD domain-containing protein [Candidatus Omnitrophota bacterium]